MIMDLGSAVLSAELALELLPEPGIKTRLVPAGFVEGILLRSSQLLEVLSSTLSPGRPRRQSMSRPLSWDRPSQWWVPTTITPPAAVVAKATIATPTAFTREPQR